jgi:hypothetical protein
MMKFFRNNRGSKFFSIFLYFIIGPAFLIGSGYIAITHPGKLFDYHAGRHGNPWMMELLFGLILTVGGIIKLVNNDFTNER